jgi:hypothetical protein
VKKNATGEEDSTDRVKAPYWAEINTVEHGVEDGSNICEVFPVGIVAIYIRSGDRVSLWGGPVVAAAALQGRPTPPTLF